MMNARTRFSARAGSLATASGAVIVLLIVLVSAVAIVRPLPSNLPAGTDVSPADTSGINVLEPAGKERNPAQQGKLSNNDSIERVVGEWTPTGGGSGGGGSPKK
jgi:hypothetical protein